jgi:hypothetical protein
MRPEIRRITDLFQEGQEVVLRDEPAVLVWVQKLNPFERQECATDGASARARLVLALQQNDSPEALLFRSSLHKVTDEQLVDAIVRSYWSDDMNAGVDDVRADQDWKERLTVIERGFEQTEGRDEDDPEVQVLTETRNSYLDEVAKRADRRQEDRRTDLIGADRKELVDEYEQRWIDSRGSSAFSDAFRATEIYFSLRECQATAKDGNGRWQHDGCDHTRKWLDHRNEVSALPDGLIGTIREAIDRINMSPRDAKNSDRPGSSSASSPAQSEAAVSTASTQEETPSEPAGTSASLSPTP